MSIFTEGKRYQGDYFVEHIVSFFNGQLAISQFLDERFYLQSAPLVREFTTLEFYRFKKLYDECQFELLLPVSDLFLEGDHMVFAYPYQPIHPIRDIVMKTGVSDDQIISWFYNILQTEMALQSMGIPMYIIRDPRNIGINSDGELKVIFTGIEDVTLYESTINWGTFLYCIATGEYIDESMRRLPSKHSLSKPVAKIIQKSFKARNLKDLFTIVEQALNRNRSGGLISSLFGKRKKEPSTADESLQLNMAPTNIEEEQPIRSMNEESKSHLAATPEPFNQSEPTIEASTQDQLVATEHFTNDGVNTPPNQLDPFEQQLEEMYQAMEQNQQEKVDDQEGLDQNQKILSIESASLEEVNGLNSQTSGDESIISSKEETPLMMNPDQKKAQEESLNSKNNRSQNTLTSGEKEEQTQIFSAADLESLEAELAAIQMQQEDKGKQSEEVKQEKTEQPIVQPPEDHLAQLEDLFGELELMKNDQPVENHQPSDHTNDKNRSEINQTGQLEAQPTPEQDPLETDLDGKVQELERLFDELNQIQTIDNESNEGSIAPSAEKKKEDKDEIKLDIENRVVQEKKGSDSPSAENVDPVTPNHALDPIEKLRYEFEQEQQVLLARQRQKLQEQQEALIIQAQEELKKRQQELLKEIEQQEEEMLRQLEAEFEKRKQEEMRKMELNTLREKHDNEVAKGIDEIRKKYRELEKQELVMLDQEFARRKKEVINRLKEEQVEQEKEFKEQKEKEWNQLLEKIEKEESEQELSETEGKEEQPEDESIKTVKEKSKATTKKNRKRKKTKNQKQNVEKKVNGETDRDEGTASNVGKDEILEEVASKNETATTSEDNPNE